MDSISKSFKSHGSSKYSPSWSSSKNEERPILAGDDPDDRREVVVKIDGNSNSGGSLPSNASNVDRSSNIWRESSYDFWKEGHMGNGEGGSIGPEFSFPKQNQAQEPMTEISEDPPSRLIRKFINMQRASGAEMALDIDLEMDELKKSEPESKELRVSFVPESSEPSDSSDDEDARSSVQRRGRQPASPLKDGGAGEVLRCTSNLSFHRASTLLRVKTRSRLMDPPTFSPTAGGISPPAHGDEGKSGYFSRKSGQLKSGLLGKVDEDDEDPFLDEDLPEDFKTFKFGTIAILQLVSLVLILGALVCSLSIRKLQRLTVWKLHLWKWEVMVLALICGRLLSGWIIRVAVFFIERNFLLRKRVLYFVYGVRNAVQNCLWLGLVLLTWHYMFDKKVQRETNSLFLRKVTQVLLSLLFMTLVWLIKTLLVKVLASSFHVSTYFDRIQESLFNQYVIETLSGPPLVEIQHNREEEDRVFAEVQRLQNAGARIPNDLREAIIGTRSGRVIGGSGIGLGGTRKSMQLGAGKSMRFSEGTSKREDAISIDQLHKLNQKNVSAWNMKRLMKIVRNGTLTTLDEQLVHEHGEDESAMQIRSEFEAKIAARKIFHNVARPGSK